MALTAWSALSNLVKGKAQNSLMFIKGVGVNEIYALEADPTTGALPVTGTVVTTPSVRTSVLLFRNVYSSTNVTTSAYVQVTASTSAAINRIYVFDSSGSAMIIAVGAAASEVDQVYVPPGGAPYPFELLVASGSRISIKALDTNATTGQMIITALS